MTTERPSSVALVPPKGPRTIRDALLRTVQVLAIVVFAVTTPLTDALTPGPPWAPTWPGRIASAVVLLVSAFVYGADAVERHRRSRPFQALIVLTLIHVVLIPVVLVGPLLPVTAEDLRSATSTLVAVGCLAGGPAAVFFVRARSRLPRWAPGTWIEASAAVLGVLAIATAAAGLALPPTDGRSPGFLPPVQFGVITLTIVVALTAASAGVTRSSVARPLTRLSAGLALVAASSVVHDALEQAGSRSADVVSGVVMLTGFVIGARSPGLWRPSTTRLVNPAERRRTGSLLIPRRVLVVPTLLSTTSLVLIGMVVVDAQRHAGPSGPSWSLGIPWAAPLLALGCIAVRLGRLGLAQRVPGGFGTGVSLAGTDDLTGLADRHALAEALDGEGDLLDAAGGAAASVSLLIVDLDRFKEVNDGLGHDAGDRLLGEVGRRLRTVLRPHQMLARLAGDEFAVLLPGADAHAARRVADDLRASLREPFGIDGSRVHLTAAVGIAAVRPAVEAADDLLRRADVAMYAAKASGAGVEVYDATQDTGGVERLRRIDELRDALENGDLEVHLQPQVELATGALVGAEALARWRHPQDGVLLPDAFLPLAAQTGLMRPVAALVLDRALEACASWRQEGHEVTVSVNITPDDLRDPGLTGLVERTLARHRVPPAALCLEITEDALLHDPAATATVLARWRDDGIAVAVDDYGTGYSSLAYLRELPVDEVKLDQVFAGDLDSARTSTIVRHTVAMAHGLRLRVVAEGIEDEATARALAEMGADLGQGLWFGPAMTPAEFLVRLAAGPGEPLATPGETISGDHGVGRGASRVVD